MSSRQERRRLHREEEKRKAKQQRARIPSDNLLLGISDAERIEALQRIQRFKIDSQTIKRFLEYKQRELEATKRNRSLKVK